MRTITLAAVLLVLAAGSWFVWQRQRPPVPAASTVLTPPPAPSARTEETLAGSFYLPADGLLTAHPLAVGRQPESQLQARDAVLTIFAERRSELIPVLKDLRLRSLYLDAHGTAYLDLSTGHSGQREVRASAWDEVLAVYALVNTVMRTVPEVRQVRLLVDGRESQTLAGHLDLSRAFVARMDLVRPQ